MSTRVDADIDVERFGFSSDENGKRLTFPHAQTRAIEGRSGHTAYGANECDFEGLEGRLDTLRWKADATSIGSVWIRDDAGRIDLAGERAELPHGIRLVRAEDGVELLSPHVTLSEVRITMKGPFGRSGPEPDPAPAPTTPPLPDEAPVLRQQRLRFLDSLSGRIGVTLKVRLDLPVLGHRSLDQQLRVPIQEGSLDYRKLDESLDWLEGAFVDIKHEDARLKVVWKVPIFGASHDLISWALDDDASTLASFGRVPARSLADFRLGSGRAPTGEARKRKVLQAFSLDAIDMAVSLLAPRHVEIGDGLVQFGGDDQPGLVDLKVTGEIHDKGAGALRGAIGSVDTTVKDLALGPVTLSADRLHLDGLDQLEVTFDGFRIVAASVVVHRVTATNLSLKIGR